MGQDRHGPPSGLTEEKLRRWHQWRKFTWPPGDIKIIKPGDDKKPEGPHGGRDYEQPRDTGGR